MNDKKRKQIISLLLLMTILLTGCSTVPSNQTSSKNTTNNATVGQLADYFINASEKYNQSINRTDVLKGLKESNKANQLQMLVLASRAFGKLPAPKGYAKRIAPPKPDLKQVPNWAKKNLKNMADSGILTTSDLKQETNTSDSSSKKSNKKILDNLVTMKDAQMIAARYFAAIGTNLKDDFYTTVNKKQLNSLEIPNDAETAGGSSTVTANTDKQLNDLILEIVNSKTTYTKGSLEQKIRDFYESFENIETRNQAGLKPLQKYLDAVDHVTSFSELNKAIANAVNELGTFANSLIPGIPVIDTKDSSRKVLQLLTMVPTLSEQDYQSKNEMYKEYQSNLIKQLMAVGENKNDAKRHADGILQMEQNLVENMEQQDESGKIKEQKYYTPKTFDKMMPEAKLSELIYAIGLKSDVKMVVFDDKQFKAYSKWFTNKNLELFKSIQKITLLTQFSSYLSTDLAEQFGVSNIPSADIAVQNFLSEELGKLYTDRYFTEESKKDIEKMTAMLIDTFKERIKNLDWMKETTKKEALKKLDTITVLIGYPDEWQFNDANIKSISDGGSYFENVAASEANKWKNLVEELEKPVNPRRFALMAYTVNAAASRSTNTILFPAGILQAPFYDKNASFEKNLGSIGSTIAHEITHMFDDGGAQYDAKGNVKNWWSNEDYSHFKSLCKEVEAFYDGREVAPGIKANGKETLSENIADIGGIACGLDILSKMKHPDYDAYFRSYANQWLRVANYDTLKEMAETDTHAPNNLRCNLVLSNFQEFYDTYGIGKSDGMYVAPKNRIKIW